MASLISTKEDKALLVVEYRDLKEGFKGWLVIDGLDYPLCAGGMRVQPGLSREHLIDMAKNMTLKMQICGLPISGAKCGIDYDPASPGKIAAMARFMEAIKPYIIKNYSMGPDLNTDMAELESIAAELDIPSVKMAIAEAQKMEISTFLDRYNILNTEALMGWKLGKIRAGYGVSMASLACLKHKNIQTKGASVAVQGFGNLAKAAIIGLMNTGVKIKAISDAEKTFLSTDNDDLNLTDLLKHKGTMLPEISHTGASQIKQESSDFIYSVDCDLLILAAVENVISENNAEKIKTKIIVPGANLAVTDGGEDKLFEMGVTVLPSFLAGCGGSLSMNGLFGPTSTPTAADVLRYIEQAMKSSVQEILDLSDNENISPTKAALELCRSKEIPKREKPYYWDLKK